VNRVKSGLLHLRHSSTEVTLTNQSGVFEFWPRDFTWVGSLVGLLVQQLMPISLIATLAAHCLLHFLLGAKLP